MIGKRLVLSKFYVNKCYNPSYIHIYITMYIVAYTYSIIHKCNVYILIYINLENGAFMSEYFLSHSI